MVAPSSTSEAWNRVYCCSGSSESSEGISSCRETPSSVHPCEVATERSSSSVSDSVT